MDRPHIRCAQDTKRGTGAGSTACVDKSRPVRLQFFFFNDTATTEIYTLSLHDALPIFGEHLLLDRHLLEDGLDDEVGVGDRKSTRLNSSHGSISYAVFCLKKKNTH